MADDDIEVRRKLDELIRLVAASSRPNPDPTVLTTEALHREVEHVNERTQALIALVEEKISHAADIHDRIDTDIAHLTKMLDAKIDATAAMRNAMLTAFQLASDKAEQRFTKQIDQMSDLFHSKIDDLNKRLEDSVLLAQARDSTLKGGTATWGIVITIITTIVSVATLFGLFIFRGQHQ